MDDVVLDQIMVDLGVWYSAEPPFPNFYTYPSIEALSNVAKRQFALWSESGLNTVGQGLQVWNNIHTMLENARSSTDSAGCHRFLVNAKQNLNSPWALRLDGLLGDFTKMAEHESLETARVFLDAVATNTGVPQSGTVRALYIAYNCEIVGKGPLERVKHAKSRGNLDQTARDFHVRMKQTIDALEEVKGDVTKFQASLLNSQAVTINALMADVEKTKQSLIELLEHGRFSIAQTESGFNDLMALKKPKEYWVETQTDAKKSYQLWTLTAILSGIGLAVIAVVPLMLEQIWKIHLFGSGLLQSGSITGIVSYGSVLAMVATLLRQSIKIATSSLHIHRDAGERIALTMAYLSIKKETGDIGEEDRKIILMALFARREAGLLKGESGPTIPGAELMARLLGVTKS